MTTQYADSFRAPGVFGYGGAALPTGVHPGVVFVAEAHLSARDIELGFNRYDSTACDRGYVATWAIVDGSLFLEDLHGYFKLSKPGPLLADWVSGWVVAEYGEPLSKICFPLEPTFEHCRAYLFDKGQLVRYQDQPSSPGDAWLARRAFVRVLLDRG